jgi:hypothetical protein
LSRSKASTASRSRRARAELAVADLIIALVLGHGGLPPSFSPRGAGDLVALLPQRRSAPYSSTARNCQLTNWYIINYRVIPKRDPRVFGASLPVPCQAFDCCRASWPSL